MSAPRLKKGIHPFCHEHLSEMILYRDGLPKTETNPIEVSTYVCSKLDCFVHYNTSKGYFIAAKEGQQVEHGTTPRVLCPNDRLPMYLAEVHPERSSYRLWRCPQCGKNLTNLDSAQAS